MLYTCPMHVLACARVHAGFPSVGKSTILSVLTGTKSEVAAYEFTTLTCIPGIIHYNEAKIQLLDLPGIIEGAAEGRGEGLQYSPMSSKEPFEESLATTSSRQHGRGAGLSTLFLHTCSNASPVHICG